MTSTHPGKVDLCIQHDPGNRPATSKESADLKSFEPIPKLRLSRYATTKNASRACCDPPGSESMTCRLQVARPDATSALPASMTRVIARIALVALGFSGATFHEPFHADGGTTVHSGNRAQWAAPGAVTPQLDMVRQDSRTGQEVEQVVALPNRPTLRPHATRRPRPRATAHLARAAWARSLTP